MQSFANIGEGVVCKMIDSSVERIAAQPSEASRDALWVVAKLYFDDMLDKRMDIIEDVPRVITRIQYLLNAEVRRRAHQDADERWRAEADAALEQLRAGVRV